MNGRYSLVVSARDWDSWCQHFAVDDERMAFGYCGGNLTDERTELIVRATDLPGDHEYRRQSWGGVALKAGLAGPRLIRARGCAAFIDAHSHPFTDAPSPSSTDLGGAVTLRRILSDLAPGAALACLIFGRQSSVWAGVLSANGNLWGPVEQIVVLGLDRRTVVVPVNAHLGRLRSTNWDARTLEVLGSQGASEVRRLKVVVIGGGGVGSAVIRQLSGYIDDIAIVDPDVVEAHNAPRLYNYAAGDEGQPKVWVHAREVLRAFPDVTIRTVQARFPSGGSLDLLKRADFVFCCPDNNLTRYAVCQGTARYFKPVIEVGCGGKKSEAGLALGYHVRLQVPGSACLACNGMDLRDLEDESSTEFKRQAGYVAGGEPVNGELMPLTTRAAADAVDLFFRYVTGYLPYVPRHLYADVANLRLIDATAGFRPQPGCTLCGDNDDSIAGTGDLGGPDAGLNQPPEGGDRATEQTGLDDPVSA
jgi:molybdopterin/thiamine biosynthesis adenylyltransferase